MMQEKKVKGVPSVKNVIILISSLQASDESKKVEYVSEEQHDSQENSTSLENDSMLLPHDRVGSDFSWLQVQSQEDTVVRKTAEFDDEESFLYGNEDTGEKQSNTALFAAYSQIGEHVKPQHNKMESCALDSQHHQNKSIFSNCGDLLDSKQPLQISSSGLASANLDSSECEKIKNILKSLGTVDIREIMGKMQGQKEGKHLSPAQPPGPDPAVAAVGLPALSNPNVRQALESLQSLIKGINLVLNEKFKFLIQLARYKMFYILYSLFC